VRQAASVCYSVAWMSYMLLLFGSPIHFLHLTTAGGLWLFTVVHKQYQQETRQEMR